MFKKYFKNLDLSFYNLPNKNDFLKVKNKPNLKKISNLNKINSYDKIIISSFEFQRDIVDFISEKVNKDKIFQIYDNSSRSLMDSFLIKNIHTKKEFTNLVHELKLFNLL